MVSKSWKQGFNFISSLMIAFFIIAAIGIIIFPESRTYYNIKLIEMRELVLLIPGFFTLTIITFLVQMRASKETITLTTSLFWIVFLFVFAIKSPVVSLAIGAFLFAIPAMFSVVVIASQIKVSQLSTSKLIIRLFFIGLNLLIFVLLFTWIFVKSNQLYLPYTGQNASSISVMPIFNENSIQIWKIGLYVFGGSALLYTLFTIIKKLDISQNRVVPIVGTILPVILLVAQVVVFSFFMVYHVKSINTATYDFGIFTQMFFNMKNMQGMVTTLERSVEMSHLAVHFSPIYYVMLPVFIIFPYPDTLQVLQVLIAASGVIPLYFIMKELKTGKFMQMLFLIMYIASPAIISSSLYHLHENCFLVPLLLSVIYFGIKQKTIPFFIFGVLTLIVKEDAGLYLVFIGLYFAVCELFSGKSSTYKRKNVIHGLILTFASLGYFLIVTNYLNTSGDGAMFWRYNNINGYSDHGLIGILLSVFQDPAYFFATFFSPSKMATMIILLASVGFLPLFVRNKTVLILAVPIIIMNFASNYSYQHQFGFQYFYGSGSLLLFMALLAEKDNREKPMFDRVFCKFKPLHLLGLIGMAVSFSFGTSYLISSELGYRIYQSDPAKFDSMRLTLESIPREKSVVATTFLTPLLANRYYLYDYDYYNILNADQQIDYVIVDMRMNQADINKIRLRCMQAGFIESPLSTEYILIFVPDTNTP